MALSRLITAAPRGTLMPNPAEKHVSDWLFLPYPERKIHGHDAEPVSPAEIPFGVGRNALIDEMLLHR